MADSAPALKTLLKLIGKKYLKQMFDVCKVETHVNWAVFSESFEKPDGTVPTGLCVLESSADQTTDNPSDYKNPDFMGFY